MTDTTKDVHRSLPSRRFSTGRDDVSTSASHEASRSISEPTTTTSNMVSTSSASGSSGTTREIHMVSEPPSDRASLNSYSSISSRGMPADEFNRLQFSKRSSVVKSILKKAHAEENEALELYEFEKKAAEEKRIESERKLEERLRTQAIRGQVTDELTRISYTLPYLAEKTADTELQATIAVMRLALKKPQSRYRLGQMIAHFRKSKQDPERTEGIEAEVMEELEQLVREVWHGREFLDVE